jgi:hypothetical protein
MARRGIKVCCRAIDILGGRSLPLEIARLMERSRKTVALLTNDYVRDMWCMREFDTAIDLGINRGQEMLIPVWMEDPDPRVVHDGVLRYLRVNGCVQYSNDMSEQAFMEYLTFQIWK